MEKEIKPYCPLCHKEFSEDVKFCAYDGIKLLYSPRDSLEGRILNQRYEILKVIGEGGMGIVYKARQLSTGKIVAVKIIHSAMEDWSSIQRFKREVKLQSMLQHPNIVNVFDFDESDDGKHYFVMDFVEGKSLKNILAETGILPLSLFFELTVQICDGIHYAHSKGIIHRDLKTENIFVVTLSHQKIVKILDFGLAKAINVKDAEQTGLSSTGVALGTPNYISPEQAKGENEKIGPRSDVYSLGVILYQMLTNRLPFEASSPWGVIHKHINEIPTSVRNFNINISRKLEKIVMRCLEKRPDQRFASALEIKQAIEKVKSHTRPSLLLKPPQKPELQEPRHTRSNVLLWIFSLLLAGVIPFYSELCFSTFYFSVENGLEGISVSRLSKSSERTRKWIGKIDEILPREKAATGCLRIISSPSGAEVFQDQRFLGNTPGLFGPFLPGEINLILKKKDYLPAKINTTVSAKKSRPLQEIRLAPVSGNLLIEVSIEGEKGTLPRKGELKIGSSEWREVDLPWTETGLLPQEYQVQLRIEGYKIQEAEPENLEVLPDQTRKMTFLIRPYPESFYIRGKEKIISQNYREAFKEFGKAVEIQPDYCEAWYWYGHVSELTGNFENACRAYRQFLILSPKDSPDYQVIKDKFPGLLKIVLKSQMAFYLGTLAYREGRMDLAIRHFTKAIRINQSFSNARLWRASAYSGTGKNVKALQEFKALEGICSEEPLFHFERGLAFYRTGSKENSLSEWAKAVKLDPNYPDAFFCLGKTFFEMAEYEKANECLRKAIMGDPERFAIRGYKLLSFSLRNVGDEKQASYAFQNYLELLPETAATREQKQMALSHWGIKSNPPSDRKESSQ